MNRRALTWLAAGVIALIAWWTPVGARPVAAATAEITEGTAVSGRFARVYAVQNGARNVVAEAPGKIWFTATDAGGIGVLTVTSDPNETVVRYRVEFYGLGENSQPYDLDIANGTIWFTLRGLHAVGRLEIATRDIQIYPLPTSGSAPTGIDVAPDGQVWIAASDGRIVRFDPATATFIEYLFPDDLIAVPRVEEIVYQNSRTIWFTMPDANQVVVYNSVTDRFFQVPTGDLQPTGLSTDSSGRVWITTAGSGRVGVFAPNTLTRWEYYLTSSPISAPAGVVVFSRNGVLEVWYAESGTGLVGRLVFAQNFAVARRYALPPATPLGKPWGVTVAADDHVWLADTVNNVLYELTPPYVHERYWPLVAR